MPLPVLISLSGAAVFGFAALLTLGIFGPRHTRRYWPLGRKPPRFTLRLPGWERGWFRLDLTGPGVSDSWLFRDYLIARQLAKESGRTPRWLRWFEICSCLAAGCFLLAPGVLVIEPLAALL